MKPDVHSAAAHGYAVCGVCERLVEHPGTSVSRNCPRCHSRVYLRMPNSISRSSALLMAAWILFIPANTLPIMETGSLFGFQRDTILSGIAYLWKTGSFALALIVFIASILVPLAKLIFLTYLLVSTQRAHPARRLFRTRLYAVLEFIGRWSMLDIYVVTLLSVLVQLNELASIYPMPGALAFGSVVVLTMLATHAFDPRLIWDGGDKPETTAKHPKHP